MTTVKLTLDEVNEITSDNFIKIFGNIVEHYSFVAIRILKNRPFATVDDISNAANEYLESLSDLEKEKILQLHPDLAGKLAEVDLTPESQSEQYAAGLNVISQEEKIKLNSFNKEYKAKFGFPFVICARENKILTILSSIEARLHNTKENELKIGIEEVKKICKLRIQQMVI